MPLAANLSLTCLIGGLMGLASITLGTTAGRGWERGLGRGGSEVGVLGLMLVVSVARSVLEAASNRRLTEVGVLGLPSKSLSKSTVPIESSVLQSKASSDKQKGGLVKLRTFSFSVNILNCFMY